MKEETVIRTENLTKHYGDVRALVDLNLEIKAGEIFGFLGPNGAGKTTTIRTVLDEIRPTSGRASILGMDTHKQSVEIRKHLGYLPGDLAMYPNLTGGDTITFFANLRGGVDAEMLAVYAVVNSLLYNLENADSVQILIDGAKVPTLGGNIDLDAPLIANTSVTRAG